MTDKVYTVDSLDGQVYDQEHRLADPIEMLAEINRLEDLLKNQTDHNPHFPYAE